MSLGGKKLVVSELDVSLVKLVAEGYSTSRIAKFTGLSQKTVEYSLIRLRRSFGCLSLANLVYRFCKLKLIK